MKVSLREGLKLSGLTLDEEPCCSLELYLSELMRWNQSVNLTAIKENEEAIEKHLIDSVLLAPFLPSADSLLDMGSGAGLPSIPLSIVLPELTITSVDSVGKKIRFQRHAKRLLRLKRFFPLHSRLEQLSGELENDTRFDVITARAFSSIETIVRIGAPWLSATGRFLLMKGPEGEAETLSAGKIIAEKGLVIQRVHKYVLPFSLSERQIIVLAQAKQSC